MSKHSKMKLSQFFPLLLLLFSCSSSEKQIFHDDNIVRFGEAIKNTKKVRLSELVDKIELVPLETNEHSMLRDTYWYTHTPPYICVCGHLFDYKGKYKFKIGNKGLGPCEDFYTPVDVLYNPVYKNFLSKGSKMIIYDEKGDCTRVERQLFLNNKKGQIVSGKERFIQKAVAGENFVFINKKSDSLLWVDVNLKDVKQLAIPISGRIDHFLDGKNRYARIFTTHHDSTLFYNYWNDTIYRVNSTNIEPRWIINLGDEKAPEEVRIRYDELLEEKFHAMRARYASSAKDHEVDAIRLTQNKKAIWAVHETSDFLFFTWSKISPNNVKRDITDFQLQVGYYNKKTRETVAVEGGGFIDDIFFTGRYHPKFGVFDNKLMQVIWPYELASFIEQKQREKKKVHPKLLELSKKISDEDNPFLMVAHLKNID